VDLTPNLQKNPVQVDVLGSANQCILAQLGSTGIQPGTYRQIRILLGGGRVAVSNNKCGSSINCVMLSSEPTGTPRTLLLAAESQTGIKIPPGQIQAASLWWLRATTRTLISTSTRALRS
jgi:hypothetical protein